MQAFIQADDPPGRTTHGGLVTAENDGGSELLVDYKQVRLLLACDQPTHGLNAADHPRNNLWILRPKPSIDLDEPVVDLWRIAYEGIGRDKAAEAVPKSCA